MAVSKEFAQAVLEKNYLRVRIMLKDSLLIDKTFKLFSEMQSYSSAQGVAPWVDTDIPLEKAEKPWTEDTMNYELTAIVNDFTKEHVAYVKEIISEVYKVNATVRPATQTQPVQNPAPVQSSRLNTAPKNTGGSLLNSHNSGTDPYNTILSKVSRINKILKENKDGLTNKRSWRRDDISLIKMHAQSIVDACNEIQRKGY